MNEFAALTPVLTVTLAAVGVMLAEAFRPKGDRMPMEILALIGFGGALVSSVFLWDHDAISLRVIRADNFALFFNVVICIVGLLTVMLSSGAADRDGLPIGEYYTLMLFSAAGMMLMGSAVDLLVIFLALEIMSLSVYVLTGIRRHRPEGAEAAFKYFLLGAFSSAFFLYGIAFAFGIAGSTELSRVGAEIAALAQTPNILMTLAMLFLMVGFAFKVSAVPFHMWTPDAYQGAPILVTGFMSTGVKAAAFAAFVRVFLAAFEPMQGQWIPVLTAIAFLTMILGTVAGVVQTSVKRMLAYSSIAHAGYIIVGLIAANDAGKASILFYVLAYSVTNLGAFGVMAALSTRDREFDDMREFTGLWHRRPGMAGLMTVFLLSLGGFPPTAGFIAKWFVFGAAVQTGHYWLAIVGVLSSVVAVFYYLRIVVAMYMTDEHATDPLPRLPGMAFVGLALALIGVIYLGILPAWAIDIAKASIGTIF
ncbi:MAG: NADH-quinone oxidoreductase subunit N [Acidobacteriota bacterium]|nr:NADH-quinone oxidoreductase subunit N [Acidobacteriota bacterium]